MGSPAGVGNTGMGVKGLGGIGIAFGDEMAETVDLADFFESQDFIFAVAVDSETGRIVASIFQPGETVKQGIDNMLAILLDEIVDVAKNATADEKKKGMSARTGEKLNREGGECKPTTW